MKRRKSTGTATSLKVHSPAGTRKEAVQSCVDAALLLRRQGDMLEHLQQSNPDQSMGHAIRNALVTKS